MFISFLIFPKPICPSGVKLQNSRALYSGAARVPAMEIVRSVSSTLGTRGTEPAWSQIIVCTCSVGAGLGHYLVLGWVKRL